MNLRRPAYIAIEGPIGVGKTTLARLLQPEIDAELVLEIFEENPFLADFYDDPERYAFQTQIFFLLSRYRQQHALRNRVGRHRIVSDYLFNKDRIFAQLNLEGDELSTYETVYGALNAQIPQPDLVIQLRASLDVLMARIAARDRPYERNMRRDYIAALSRLYDEFFQSYNGASLLVIDTDDLNVVANSDDLQEICGRVRAVLREGAFQPALPAIDEQRDDETVRPAAVASLASQLDRKSEKRGDPLRRYASLQAALGTLAAAISEEQDARDASTMHESLVKSLRQMVGLAHDLGIDLSTALDDSHSQ